MEGVGDRGDRAGHSGAGRDRGYAGIASDPGPTVGCVGGGLLVAEIDDPDAAGHAPVVYGGEVPSREGEEVVHTLRGEGGGEQMTSVPRLIHLQHDTVAVMRRGRWGKETKVAGPARAGRDWRSYDDVADVYDRVRTEFHALPAVDLVALIAPPAGGRVLDVGTGTGAAAMAASEAVGPEGLVVGLDPSLEMLRRARERGVECLVAGEALDLPFAAASFDAVVAAFVIFFFTRYETALFDMVRVLRPGGKVGVTTWGGTEDEFRRTWREVAESFVGKDLVKDAIRRASPWEERFSDPRWLQESLREAGLRYVNVQHRDYRFTWSIDDYLAGRETGVVGRFLRDMLGEASFERFRGRVEEEFRSRFADPIGDTTDVLIAVGTKP